MHLIDINFHLNFHIRFLEVGVSEEGVLAMWGCCGKKKNYSEQKWDTIVVFPLH